MIKVEPHKYRALEQTFTTSRSSSVAETLQADSSTAVSDDETDLCRAPLENPPMSPHPSVHSVVFTPGRPKLGREPSLHVFTDQTFMEAPPATAIATWQEAWWDGILSFPMTFWILCLLTVLLYGTVVPFNNIASDFLQSKWFPGRPRKATAVMGIPDTIGSILVPIFGLLVDRHGGRATILIMSAVIMVTVHSTLGFTMLNPIFAFMLLGVAYSMYGVALWPSIACVVKDEVHLGMGYGISSSFLNISLTIVPPVVATIRIIGGSFLPVEMFFISMGLAGIVAGLVLKSIDARQGGALEAPEIEVDVPVIVPPPGTSPAVITSQDGMIVNPLLSPQIKYHPTMNLGHTFLDHSPSPLGIYQHDRYGDGSADDMLQQDLVNKGYDDRCNDSGNGTSSEETAPLVEPTMSPNEGYRRSESRDRRAFTLPWNHYRVQKPSPSLLQGLRRTAPNRARSSTTRSLTADGSDSINSPHLLQPDHRQEEQQQQRRQNQSAPSLSSSTAVSSSSSRPRFYGSFSTPSIVSFGRGAVEIMVDDEATLHEPTTATTLFRPLPPRHQYSVRQHPILHNPLRGSSGSFRIHRNARRIRFGEGEEGNLFLNGLPVAHPNDLQSALLEDSGHGGSASGAGGDVAPARVLFHGVGIDGGAGSSEGDKDDDPDGQNGRQS
ncbi:hypothetical protein DFQ27_008526 [Actinomortierella ambigua]|uniref:Uncharacterized protein n=1 Tax=Actinomortierella ambigua TaxID=1343610 RepID=A0A9P6QKH5_9FUNG|nr:hypothetical protein DFQ27_008526 [Actinomortierella ambigua]